MFTKSNFIMGLPETESQGRTCPKDPSSSMLTDEIEIMLDEADKAAATDGARYTEDEVFGKVRKRVNGHKAI